MYSSGVRVDTDQHTDPDALIWDYTHYWDESVARLFGYAQRYTTWVDKYELIALRRWGQEFFHVGVANTTCWRKAKTENVDKALAAAKQQLCKHLRAQIADSQRLLEIYDVKSRRP